jgi:hypothetical protein
VASGCTEITMLVITSLAFMAILQCFKEYLERPRFY